MQIIRQRIDGTTSIATMRDTILQSIWIENGRNNCLQLEVTDNMKRLKTCLKVQLHTKCLFIGSSYPFSQFAGPLLFQYLLHLICWIQSTCVGIILKLFNLYWWYILYIATPCLVDCTYPAPLLHTKGKPGNDRKYVKNKEIKQHLPTDIAGVHRWRWKKDN